MVDEAEECMPPKMWKKWMHRELEARKEPPTKVSQDGLGITIDPQGASPSLAHFLPLYPLQILDEHQLMPPPPMPASLDPTTIWSTSAFRPTANHVSLLQRSPTRAPSTSTDLTLMSSPPPASGVSPLSSFAQLSLLSTALNSETSPTQDEEEPETYSQEGPKADIAEANQTEVPVAVTSPPEENPSPRGHILLLISKIADAASSTSCPDSVQHVINGAKNVVGDSIGDGRAEIKSAENSVSRNGSATQQECLNTNSNISPLYCFSS